MNRTVFFLAAVFFSAPLLAQEDLSAVFRQCNQKVSPSVVYIRVSQQRTTSPSGRSARKVAMQIEESGSGIVASIAGKTVIVTNRHVVDGTDTDTVQITTKDRRIISPVRITSNEDFDLAVIETNDPLPPPVVFGNSDEVETGDMILAMGSPFGLERSLSLGIVSAVGRRHIPGAGITTPRVSFFQVDAAVNPGSSGGPLINLKGEVVGLQTAIATQGGGNEGIAFITPLKTVLRITEQLVKTGSAVRPYIGCGFDAAFSLEDRRQFKIDRLIGSRIKNVDSNGPAAGAGLKIGDVILSYDGTEIEDDPHIVLLVAESEIGKPVPVKVNRNGKVFSESITPVKQLSR